MRVKLWGRMAHFTALVTTLRCRLARRAAGINDMYYNMKWGRVGTRRRIVTLAGPHVKPGLFEILI